MSAVSLLAKSERALVAARRSLEQGDTETAADRVYYAVFYAAWGLLDAAGVPRPKTHNGLIAEFSRVYVKSQQIDPATAAALSRLQNLRLVADYTLEAIPLQDAQRAIKEADGFIAAARSLITTAQDPAGGCP